jgi:sporulation integral membrane protein YlbJ
MFNIFLLTFPQIVLTASRDGLMLWFNNVLPTLLPFMIATNMLIALGFADFCSVVLSPVMKKIFRLPGVAGFGLFAGITSGYPMGAKTVADLYKKGQLTTQEAQHLLAFCNNAGPLFILGVVGVGMFQSAYVGYILWAAHILAAFAVGIIFRPKKIFQEKIIAKSFSRHKSDSVGKVLGDAVKNSMESITIIGGLIIFFSVVLAALETFGLPNENIFGGIAAGLVEVTGGSRRISSLEPTLFTLASAAFVIAFGGFSVHAQSFHFTSGTGIKNHKYIFAKFLHGIIAAIFTVTIFTLFA